MRGWLVKERKEKKIKAGRSIEKERVRERTEEDAERERKAKRGLTVERARRRAKRGEVQRHGVAMNLNFSN